jgi:hypothetical protein
MNKLSYNNVFINKHFNFLGKPLAGDRDEEGRGTAGVGGDLRRRDVRAEHASGNDSNLLCRTCKLQL